MNKLFLTVILLVVAFTLPAQVYHHSQAQALVKGASTVRLNPEDGRLQYIRFEQGKELNANELLSFIRQAYRLGVDYTLEQQSSLIDQMGQVHTRYRLLYRGVEVHEGRLISHANAQGIYALNGFVSPAFKPANTIVLSEKQALQQALSYVNAKVYKWQLKEEEGWIKKERGDASASWYPKGSLSIKYDQRSGQYRYAWVFDVYAHRPMSRADYYVDAANGRILYVNNHIHHSDSLGSAVTKYSGTRPITTDFYGNTFRLRESGRGLGIETYDLNQSTSYGSAMDFTDSDNNWNNVNAQQDEIAGDAHWGLETTYDYYLQKHNRNSIDGNGYKLKGYVHYNQNYVNAFWNGNVMTFGDGNSNYGPLVALDIVGHEITHGLTEHTANLDYSYESGAMNEAFSDIFGTAIEFYAKGQQANWNIGEDIGAAFRSMSNPKLHGDPDTYYGQNYYTGSADNGGVHTNSGVLNHWFYLLAAGDSGVNDLNDTFNVPGVGVDTAANIAFRLLTVYLVNTSQYADARFYGIQAALDLYGPCSRPVKATTKAFYAVGIGPDYVDSVQADFVSTIQNYCTTPAVVLFKNQSNNGINFYWDFGDGDTSMQISPVHSYSALGNYSVTLVASGGACGMDTAFKYEYISVDTLNPCFTSMPASGSQTLTTCQGVLFDDGGVSNNYSANSNSKVVLAPFGAATLTLTFTDFHFESGYDYLKIYDGPNTMAPLIGSFDGDNLPNGGTINSTGSSLTLVQSTDGLVEKAGFIAQWQCQMPTTAPVADFRVLDTLTCSGLVHFEDASTGGASSWLWDFGDGSTSTAQNPVHQYQNTGVYQVSLLSSNNIGNDQKVLNAAVHVELPVKPYAPSQAVCNGGSMILHATAPQGMLLWYNSRTASTPIDTGADYTTPTLSQSMSYYVENRMESPIQNAGKPNNAGGGGVLNYSHYLIFDVYQQLNLHSVDVYASGNGSKTIYLKNRNGITLASKTVNLVSGLNTVVLDFVINPGSDYRLEGQGLYRNNNGVNYPYIIPGMLSIKQSSANTNPLKYYYYFYNWKIQKMPCNSDRVEVHAYVNQSPPVADFSYTANDPMLLFSDDSQNPGMAYWSFGDGGHSTLNNPGHLYLSNGSFPVTLSVNNGCGSDDITKTVNISLATGLDGRPLNSGLLVYPNPAKERLNIDFNAAPGSLELRLIDAGGKLLNQQNFHSQELHYQLDVSTLASGLYYLQIIQKEQITIVKVSLL